MAQQARAFLALGFLICLSAAKASFVASDELSGLQSQSNAFLRATHSPSPRKVGILYEVWHTFAAAAMREVAEKGGPPLTVERVLQSNGKSSLNDIYKAHNVTVSQDIWNVEPELGFYCMYRPREGEKPAVEGCEPSRVAEEHARMLVDAGIDYIVVDLTNWPDYKAGNTDPWVLRPTEVLFEEWYNLRQRGVKTPQISLWPCSTDDVPRENALYAVLLDRLYNNDTYSELVYHDEITGKKVMFTPTSGGDDTRCATERTQADMESNSGRNDVIVRRMWALFGKDQYENGTWGFFSPCTSGSGYTTSIVGEDQCDQHMTRDPKTHALVAGTASPSYMLARTAVPFGSPGKFRGLTLSHLFRKILEANPPHVMLSSFNEHIGGRQPVDATPDINYNMGLPNEPAEQKYAVWVDTYGYEFSRDLEPSKEGGDFVWRVLSACLALYKAGHSCSDAPQDLCCTTEDKDVFANIWSLSSPDGDHLLTSHVDEKSVLIDQGWKENCAWQGSTSFCQNLQETDGRTGPFILYKTSAGIGVPTTPLYRCHQNSRHWFSTESSCGGAGPEGQLGYISQSRGMETLRGLYACIDPSTGEPNGLHTLDLPCHEPYRSNLLGYVR